MTEVRVAGRDGVLRTVATAPGVALMEALRDADFGVDGTCGGACACGTCHVYVSADWSGKLPPKSEDEQAMLEAIGELVEVRACSRLSCQIRIDAALDGLQVTVGPVA